MRLLGCGGGFGSFCGRVAAGMCCLQPFGWQNIPHRIWTPLPLQMENVSQHKSGVQQMSRMNDGNSATV